MVWVMVRVVEQEVDVGIEKGNDDNADVPEVVVLESGLSTM
jgi:hypothetical protein